ncbi:alpha-N-arabinofuranosidase [Flavobacterium sp. 1]|uniref:alpha-N-arabinofuranosidase n=1 Tax=Flavobacterium sp. 1 TaxID=2035200 RepID=UPI000C239E84|nr:alpha-L-arabinofuranosidase C-terminal domain-containing protein [Flavobacterium sp. 1]PJJ07780.1 alpha-N-arabinofuranosidase [Flavobacterium sp. 1]
MKKLFLLVFISVIFQNVFSQNNVTEITIVKTENKTIINKHIYGHFAEHLGKCIYGGLFVGEDSNISNTKGVRNDIIKALKELKVPNLRWPGGCFADTYHWKDGVGPKKGRPGIVNRWWGGVEDNSFGTHEFLDMCEALGTEPYLAGNVGSGSPRELEEWVQYVNYGSGTPMSDLRKKNDKEKSWKVAFWGVGNEMWGCGGNMTPEYYSNLYKQYATFMPNGNGGEKLFRVASGANGEDYHWTEVLMRDIPKGLMEAVALHWYSVMNWEKKGSSTKFDESQYFGTMNSALKMEELVQKHSEIMDKYDQEKKIALVVDEWGGWYDTDEGANGALFQQNTMRDAMIAGVTLNVFNNHADRVRGANLAQIVNVLQAVILTDKEKMVLTPTYHVMKMYNVHQDAVLIPLKIESPKYIFDKKELPAISVSASKDKANLTHISLVNIDLKKENKIKIDLKELGIKNIKGYILSSSKVQDYNTFENPNKISPVVFNKFSIKNDKLEVTIPPFSVVVLEGN